MSNRGPKSRPGRLRVLSADKPGSSATPGSVEPAALEAMPDPPACLDRYSASLWKSTGADLIGRRMLSAIDLPLFEAYVTACSRFREADDLAQAHGEIVETNNGGLKPNPACALRKVAADMIQRIGAEFGLSPNARRQLTGTPVTDSAAGDAEAKYFA